MDIVKKTKKGFYGIKKKSPMYFTGNDKNHLNAELEKKKDIIDIYVQATIQPII